MNFIDVTSRTNRFYMRTIFRMFFNPLFYLFPHFITHFIIKQAYRTYWERTRFFLFSIRKYRKFSTTSSYIYIQIIFICPNKCRNISRSNNISFLTTINNFNSHSCTFQHFCGYLITIKRLSHSRSSTSPISLHLIYFH